jgi:hypothetical protein
MTTLNWDVRCYPDTGHTPRNSDKSPEDDGLTVRPQTCFDRRLIVFRALIAHYF